MRELGRIFTKPKAVRKVEGLREEWGGGSFSLHDHVGGNKTDRDRGSCRNRGCRDGGRETVIVSL